MTSHFPNKTESQIRRQETPPSSPIKYTNIANSTEGQYEEYCIFPRNGKNRDECLETAAFFIEILQLDYIFNYTSKYDGLLFWTAFLTPELFEDVSSYVGVSLVLPNSDPIIELNDNVEVKLTDPPDSNRSSQYNLQTRDPIYVTQGDAVQELTVVSQPPTINDLSLLPNYVYDASAGYDTWIYIIDFGINTESEDLSGRVDPDWIYSATASQKLSRNSTTDTLPKTDDSGGHGTCIASKAVGQLYGVAKRATIVCVKMYQGLLSDLLTVLDQVYLDIHTKNRSAKATVNLSWGVSPPTIAIQNAYTDIVKPQIQRLFDNDVVVVASAGNAALEEGRSSVDTLPQTWASDDFPLIVVGNVNNLGEKYVTSQGGSQVSIWAPGVSVTCAAGTGTGTQQRTGTSESGPMVAGLVAYFLSLATTPFQVGSGTTAQTAKSYLTGTGSWVRDPDGGLNVLWNGMNKVLNRPILAQCTAC
ncbi:hypothetical protein MMC20_004234 [Loxospora ochrophaea]|nr:hypothetical protein [Loxospora ochrophaea]